MSKALKQDIEGIDKATPAGIQLVASDRSAPLGKCVEDAMRSYLGTTDGHDFGDLHAMVMREVERPLLATVLAHVDGNLSHAAKILGVTRSTLRKRLNDYGIERARLQS